MFVKYYSFESYYPESLYKLKWLCLTIAALEKSPSANIPVSI